MELEKYVVVKKSTVSAKGLPVKSLSAELKQLKKEGYQIVNYIS